jgi:predicted RNA binding protein YcfA (HicA-like mRNA interferase family)
LPKPPLLSGRDIVTALKRAGYAYVTQKGSHIKLRHPSGITLIIPDHREVDRWTLRGILRAAELSVDDFLKLI